MSKSNLHTVITFRAVFSVYQYHFDYDVIKVTCAALTAVTVNQICLVRILTLLFIRISDCVSKHFWSLS